MKFWIKKSDHISLHEQIVRQVVMGIVSGDLKPNQKLLSVRAMSLRYAVHYNTVNKAYGWLHERGWIETRVGKGVYVKEKSRLELAKSFSPSEHEEQLDRLIADFINKARISGFYPNQILERMQLIFSQKKIDCLLLVEDDFELQKILLSELQEAIQIPIHAMNVANFVTQKNAAVALFQTTPLVLPPEVPQIILHFNSVERELHGKEPPGKNALIGVVSHWQTFLSWSQTMLAAAGIDNQQLLIRDAREKNWKRGLANCTFVITDVFTAQFIDDFCDVRVFRLIARDSLAELQSLIK